jgi:nicotinamidase-related amidase
MNTALLVIDVQLGNFLEPYPVHERSRLLERVKGLIDKARSAQTQIIYVQNNGGKGDLDEHGTSRWEIHPSIKPRVRRKSSLFLTSCARIHRTESFAK